MKTNKKQEKYIELVKPLLPRVERYAFTLAMNRDDARDLVQEAAIAAFKGFGRMRSEKALLSYMFTVVRRRYFKSVYKNKKYDDSEDDILDLFRSSEIPPDEQADLRIIMEAIGKLSPDSREILIMFEFSGLAIKEIAQISGKSQSAVKTSLHRSRKKLAEMLRADNKEKIHK
jgi:RNA polymerase sigma-70 factor (ECF subfamily)